MFQSQFFSLYTVQLNVIQNRAPISKNRDLIFLELKLQFPNQNRATILLKHKHKILSQTLPITYL